MSKQKSPTAIGLGDCVLPDKEKFDKILTELRRDVNPCDMADDILGPFYEIMGQMRRVR